MNRTVFTGRLTRDPELKHTTSGTAVLSASIAIDDGWGEKKKTYFPSLVFWRNNAEYVGKYARKGDLMEVSARYTERKYQDRDGNNRTAKEFVVDEVKILSSRHSDGQEDAQGAYGGRGWNDPYNENGPAQGAYGGYTQDEYSDAPDEGELPF